MSLRDCFQLSCGKRRCPSSSTGSQLVQIIAYADDDAYAIFETMNDRGLKLTPADMLKGYLLANMEDGKPRAKTSDLWRRRLRVLNERDDDSGSDFRLLREFCDRVIQGEGLRVCEGERSRRGRTSAV
jgi:hypothetical protein